MIKIARATNLGLITDTNSLFYNKYPYEYIKSVKDIFIENITLDYTYFNKIEKLLFSNK